MGILINRQLCGCVLLAGEELELLAGDAKLKVACPLGSKELLKLQWVNVGGGKSEGCLQVPIVVFLDHCLEIGYPAFDS